MTASEGAKFYGFKSLSELARLSKIPRRTLENWSKNDWNKFILVCLGTKERDEKLQKKQHNKQ